jgi:hypothetical protein
LCRLIDRRSFFTPRELRLLELQPFAATLPPCPALAPPRVTELAPAVFDGKVGNVLGDKSPKNARKAGKQKADAKRAKDRKKAADSPPPA